MGKTIKVGTGSEHRFRRERRKYFGQIKGPAGPLKNWPFLLKRDGKPIGQASLDGHTLNKPRNGAWISGAEGEFRFEDLPDAEYGIEVLYPTGKLVAKDYSPPNESGRRSPLPPLLDRLAFAEDPDDIVSDSGEAYVISAEIRVIGDTLLVNQDVRIIDPDTLEQVGEIITTGDDGVVRAVVPQDKTYRIEIADQEFDPVDLPPDADEEPALLLCHFFDETGAPIANQSIEARSGNDIFELTTDEDGKIEAPAHLVPYELKLGDQVFHAHAVLLKDRDRDESRYHFTLSSDGAPEDGDGPVLLDDYPPLDEEGRHP